MSFCYVFDNDVKNILAINTCFYGHLPSRELFYKKNNKRIYINSKLFHNNTWKFEEIVSGNINDAINKVENFIIDDNKKNTKLFE